MKPAILKLPHETIEAERISVMADPLHDTIVVFITPLRDFVDRLRGHYPSHITTVVSTKHWLKVIEGSALLNVSNK